jgi:hypothetical protein
LKRTKKLLKKIIKLLLLIMFYEMTTFEHMKLVMEESKDAQKENVEEAPLEEPPPKPPEYIANEKVALDAALPLLVEGKTKGKTIAELMAGYLSNNVKKQLDQPLECPNSENKLPHTNITLVHDVPFFFFLKAVNILLKYCSVHYNPAGSGSPCKEALIQS